MGAQGWERAGGWGGTTAAQGPDAGSVQGVLCLQPPAPLCSPLLQPLLSLPETAKSPAAEGSGFPGALGLEDTEW